MPDREARAYLERALKDKGVPLSTASQAVGKSHAYLQQYIKLGKPRWLSEQIRDALVMLYGVDGGRLKPPSIQVDVDLVQAPQTLEGAAVEGSGSESEHQRDVNPPRMAQLIDQPSLIELIRVWGTIPENRRELALNILRHLATG